MQISKIIFVIFFTNISTSYGLDLGISLSRSTTSNKYLKYPNGIGIQVTQIINQKFELNFEYNYYIYEYRYTGMVAFGFIIEPFPPTELINSKTVINSIEISSLYQVFDFDYIIINLGVGINSNSCRGYVKGLETNKRIDLNKQNKIGISFILNIQSSVMKYIPLSLFLSFKRRQLEASGYAHDGENVFSSSIGWNEIKVGVLYKLF
jgi:hypothetical protein